jgi:transcriptional regulator with XRE-family HTH domain
VEVRINKEKLRELRQRGSLSQEALAQLSGIHPRTVQRIEASGIASIQSARSLARGLNVEVTDLEQAPGVNPAADKAFLATAQVLMGVGAAFLWCAFSALVWVAQGNTDDHAPLVSILGFASFCTGLWFFSEGNRRAGLLR